MNVPPLVLLKSLSRRLIAGPTLLPESEWQTTVSYDRECRFCTRGLIRTGKCVEQCACATIRLKCFTWNTP